MIWNGGSQPFSDQALRRAISVGDQVDDPFVSDHAAFMQFGAEERSGGATELDGEVAGAIWYAGRRTGHGGWTSFSAQLDE